MVKTNLECPNCRTLNCSEIDKEKPDNIFWCQNCGVPFKPKLTEIRNADTKTALACLPLGNSLVLTPLGMITDARQEEAFYIGPDNRNERYSREEYKANFKLDPKIYLAWMHKGRPYNVVGFECRDLACNDDPLKLKQELIEGRITKSDYLYKLKILWKNGKLSQKDYDNEEMRILTGIEDLNA
jgi:hypothetical protein